MDPLRLGVRNIIGITMPGAIVVLSVCFGMWVASPVTINLSTPANAAVWLTIGFLVSYVIGSILSLRASERADRLSAALQPHRSAGRLSVAEEPADRLSALPSAGDELDTWERARKKLEMHRLETDSPDNPETALSKLCGMDRSDLRDLWINDNFPYPRWSLVRLAMYCPDDMLRFYWRYREPILAQIGKSPHFFNYCKLAVYCGRSGVANPLASEIQEAESNIRFLAGAFDALVISAGLLVGFAIYDALRPHWIILTCSLIAVAAVTYRVVGPDVKDKDELGKPQRLYRVGAMAALSLLAPLLGQAHFPAIGTVAFTEWLLAFWVVADGRLRRRRHHEVATVVDAYYLTCKTQGAARDGAQIQRFIDQ